MAYSTHIHWLRTLPTIFHIFSSDNNNYLNILNASLTVILLVLYCCVSSYPVSYIGIINGIRSFLYVQPSKSNYQRCAMFGLTRFLPITIIQILLNTSLTLYIGEFVLTIRCYVVIIRNTGFYFTVKQIEFSRSNRITI